MRYYSKHFFVVLPESIFFLCSVLIGWHVAYTYGDEAAIVNPKQGIFYEQYFSVYLGNIKCGCGRFQSERQGNNIITRSKMILKLGRDNFKFQCEVFTKTVETITGRPIRYKSEVSLGNFKSEYDCRFTNSELIVKITQNGQSSIRKFPVPDVKLSWASHLETLKYLSKYGTKFVLNTYDPQINLSKPAMLECFVAGHAEIKVAGKKISGTKIISRIRGLPVNASVAIVDAKNNPLYTEISIGTFKVIMIATNKREAISDLTTKEIFSQSLIELSKPLKFNGSCLKLKIVSSDSSSLAPLPETSMQKVIAKGDDWQILKICSGEPKSKTNRVLKTVDRKYLADSSYLNLKDLLLIKLANQASGTSKSAYAVARKLCLFVHGYITKKDLSSVFDNASHIARTRTGDCSEHSVLLASLARIKGIPSRVVTGLAYAPKIGKFGAFGYHMWVQVWLDGRWVDLDPTFGQVHPDPAHIAISFSDLSDGSLTIDNAKLAEYMGRIRIEVVDD